VNLHETLAARRSVRAYLDKPVPEDALARVLTAAQTAPSWCNIQPWRVWVARGGATKRLTTALVAAAQAGAPSTDFPVPTEYPEPYGLHRRACGKALYEAMGVARDDHAGRGAAWLRNFMAFDAPVVALVGIDKRFGIYAAIDVGCWLEALMLAATTEGLATCAQASLAMYAQPAHEVLGVPDTVGLLFGVAIGYEDTTAKANACRTTREPTSSNVTFVD
jgi:nitroreductase